MRNPPDRTACANVRWPVHTRAMAPASAVMTRSTSCPGSFKHTSTPSRSSVRCLTNPRLRVRIARNREGRCMAAELHDLSIAELSTLIAARKLSPVELTDALIRRIEDHDAQTHAFLTRTFELARRQARDAEAEIAAGPYRGALHGIPFALKDIYDTAGILTSGHSRVFMDRIPREAATAAPPARRAPPRPARHARDRARGAVVRSALAAGAQSVESRALHRRIVDGLGSGGGGRHGARCSRLGHGRLHPRAGVALWRRGP